MIAFLILFLHVVVSTFKVRAQLEASKPASPASNI